MLKIALVLGATAMVSLTAHAEANVAAGSVDAAASAKRYGLEEFVKAAETNGSALDEQNAQVSFAESRLSLARAKSFPSGKMDIFAGPTPGAKGNALNGVTDHSDWGIASGVKVDLTQPIYTFGGLSAARTAARAGVEGEKDLAERDRWKLRSQIHEFYYGYQLAYELGGVVEDLKTKLQDALDKGEKQRKNGKAHAPSAGDLDKLRVYLDEVKIRESEANKGRDQAKAAMAWEIGTYGREAAPRWDRANLVPRELKDLTLPEAQKIASESRPELKALQQDVIARTAMVTTARAQLLPALFIGGSFNFVTAPVRDNQTSPFAYDPLNDLSATAFIGIRWNLGFFEHSAEMGMARADMIKAEGRLKHLGQGILVEVEKNLGDYQHEKRSLDLRKDASNAAKHVFTDALVSFQLGTGKAQSLLESIGSYALAEKARFENIYNCNLAAAHLEQSVGHELELASAKDSQ